MLQLKNKQFLYAGVALVFIVSMFFVLSLYAENKDHSKRGAHASESKSAIHMAFEDNDYEAYIVAVTERDRQFTLTEEEFARHVQHIAKKQEIQEAFIAGDYDAYLKLTEGSMHQLSEAAFTKKSKMLALKKEMQTALGDRDYDSFVQKRQALEDLLGDEYVGQKHYSSSEEITEERFNMLADRSGKYDVEGFGRKKQRGYHGQCNRSSHHSW